MARKVVLGWVLAVLGWGVGSGEAQVWPVRLDPHEVEPAAPVPPSLVLADGDLQFPDGTVQVTAAGSGESLGSTPLPSLVLDDGGIQFSDGTIQTTAAGSLVPRTGQTTCYDASGAVIDCTTPIGLGQDGDLQLGAPWPDPRFTLNESAPGVPDGTVTDNLTGLIWLQNAHCAAAPRIWSAALADVAQLNASGTMNGNNCADTSNGGTHQTDWSLPNIAQLWSLVDYTATAIPLIPSGHPFTGFPSTDPPLRCWASSTTAEFNPSLVLCVNYYVESYGLLLFMDKETPHFVTAFQVWPVRGGQ